MEEVDMTNNITNNSAKVVKSRSTELDKRIGRNIGILRNHKGLTQGNLAEDLGISPQQITKYESGKNRVSAGSLLTIAKVLGVDIALMYEEPVVDRRINAYPKLFEYLARIECSSRLQKELYNLIEEIAFLELPGRGLSPRGFARKMKVEVNFINFNCKLKRFNQITEHFFAFLV